MNLQEVFNRYERKLINRLEIIMRQGANSLVKEYALKVLEYQKIFIQGDN
jgi:hypothetical protein